MKIEKVQNGYLLTWKSLVSRPQEYTPFVATSASFRMPMDEIESKSVFTEWNEVQNFLRKHFGETEVNSKNYLKIGE